LKEANTCSNGAHQSRYPSISFTIGAGGHVDALHRHLENTLFFRIDLRSFFYSISRSRVARILRYCEFPKSARDYAEWSTVRSPYEEGPRYVLPIGFKQSPLLASLVLYRSAVASAIEEAAKRGVFVSVYFDDLIGSCNDAHELAVTYNGIMDACQQANLPINTEKLVPPAADIIAFNCNLSHGHADVTEERWEKFLAQKRAPAAEAAFLDYCIRVADKNHSTAAAVP
jgi:hypothetical protein